METNVSVEVDFSRSMESVLNVAATQTTSVEIVFVNSHISVTVLTVVHATHHVEHVPVN